MPQRKLETRGKFHITSKGEVKPCKATARPCPYGGEEVHFAYQEMAEDYADGINELSQHILDKVSSKGHHDTRDDFEKMKKDIPWLAGKKDQYGIEIEDTGATLSELRAVRDKALESLGFKGIAKKKEEMIAHGGDHRTRGEWYYADVYSIDKKNIEKTAVEYFKVAMPTGTWVSNKVYRLETMRPNLIKKMREEVHPKTILSGDALQRAVMQGKNSYEELDERDKRAFDEAVYARVGAGVLKEDPAILKADFEVCLQNNDDFIRSEDYPNLILF